MAKRANSYSAAMVMTYKTGESPSNGAPPKVDNISDATEFKREGECNYFVIVPLFFAEKKTARE